MSYKSTIPRVCERCSDTFTIDPSRLVTRPAKYCSQVCAFAAKRSALAAALPALMDSRTNMSGDCWVWQGQRYPKSGYGQIKVAGRTRGTHAVAWELASGISVPRGMWVLHTCDNKPCRRNDEAGIYVVRGIARPRFGHLFLGTPTDNVADMTAKDRHMAGARHYLHADPSRAIRGEAHPRARLSDADIRCIRERYADGGITHAQLGIEYGMDKSVIGNIIRRKSWRHIP